MLAQHQAFDQVAARAARLAPLLEEIQAEHTNESRMTTVGRPEREVRLLNRALAEDLTQLNLAEASSGAAVSRIGQQQQQALWSAMAAGGVGLLLGQQVGGAIGEVSAAAVRQAREIDALAQSIRSVGTLPRAMPRW